MAAVDSLTIERLDQEPFIVRRGDRVKVWINWQQQSDMIVLGISPARGMVRVASPSALNRGGFEVIKWMVYPPDPEPEAPKRKNAATLSKAIARANAKNEPPGGWTENDATKSGASQGGRTTGASVKP